MKTNILKAEKWLELDTGDNFLSEDEHCPTRDIFQARLDKIRQKLEKKPDLKPDYIYPLIAVIGEIGNNAFDHNLGKWRDIAGIFFSVDFKNKSIVLADRGQGIFSSIKNVRPNVADDIEAIKIAFTQTISGRFPEKRGNGLKFVTKVAIDLGLGIMLYSGNAVTKIENKKISFNNINNDIKGVLAIIKY